MVAGMAYTTPQATEISTIKYILEDLIYGEKTRTEQEIKTCLRSGSCHRVRGTMERVLLDNLKATCLYYNTGIVLIHGPAGHLPRRPADAGATHAHILNST